MQNIPFKDLANKVESFINNISANEEVNIDLIINNFVDIEIARRIQDGKPRISPLTILIKFPENKEPIVEFDNEIMIKALAKTVPKKLFQTYNEPVYASDLQGIVDIEYPQYNGKDVGFIYIHRLKNKTIAIGNFHPELKDEKINDGKGKEMTVKELLTGLTQLILEEKIIKFIDTNREKLKKIGLWTAPSLLNYPLNVICESIENDDDKGARALLSDYCSKEFIRNMCSRWWDIEPFQKRKEHILDTIEAFDHEKYSIVIHSLLPHVEGIISDWLYNYNSSSMRFKQESKLKDLMNLIFNTNRSLSFHLIVESTINFILNGPVLSAFNKWDGDINYEFSNRHVVGHGRYDASIFTKENSIKLFLLLDTLYYIFNVLTKNQK